jgi:NitT/TauT family transport system substrate-binding protein
MTKRSALAALFIFLCIGIAVILVNKTNGRHHDRVSLRLQWIHQAQFAGFYVAKMKGFYADADIDLTIKSGGIGFNVPTLISRERDDFGLWVADQVFTAFDREKMPIRVIGTVYDRSLACFMVNASSHIYTPADFAAKRVGILHGFDTETIFNELITRFQVDPTTIKEYEVGYNLLPFLHGDVDIWPAYIINEPLAAEENGLKIRILDPASFGVRFYSDTLIVNEATLRNRRDLVLRFLESSERGWRYALSHPAEAVDMVLRFDPSLKRKHETEMLNALAPYIKNTDPLFGMSPEVWQAMGDVLQRQHQISDPNSYRRLCDFKVSDDAHTKYHNQ